MRTADPAVVVAEPPPGVARLPLVCDSPHSGTRYPADFVTRLPFARLRQAEDTHIDTLWSAAPRHGATLLAAQFPRAYIDPNRALDDLDPELLDGPWPSPLNPGEKSRLGYGLVWRRVSADEPLYDHPLQVAAVQSRVVRCWKPYHAALSAAVARAVKEFGALWHLNLHSMPDNAYEKLGIASPHPLADFVLGDREGTTCEPALLDVVEAAVRAHGYTVARNDPYKGVALIAEIGNPALARHSLQIEIRRPVYMNEATREPNEGFVPLQRCIEATVGAVAAHVRMQLRRTE
ncbi:N-formylglutamate amidohydrolase [Variovorax sp. PAMC26660]|uniref:N-formylglutamate amidohydrolase n=1 Tax=Variovorax sp. PAMC26660 TaxID=2762322 RepID=UPI00164E0983|nr:N-formylglutamate amidohydrolase [Variovorax sp. PAMC26660]QNK67329.1 N-formylglutamate amidohydrolase [Variovorax sp. PAMC26660]